MAETAILTEKLTKRYGERVAVDGLDLEVLRGEVFGFLGPNGAGKTTTIAMLLGLIRPTSGRAFVLGHDVSQNLAAALHGTGAMIEAPAFYPYMSGYDNLRVLAHTRGVELKRIDAVLSAVELSARARDKVQIYSQGMKQRLAIAAALLGDPQLIILDEPTNGLDPAGTVEIRDLIRNLAAQGHTIFLCSHLLHEVEQVCGRVAILKTGRLLALGAVRDLLKTGGVLVRLEADAERAAALLRTQPWVAAVAVNGLELTVDAPVERSAELNVLLAREGFLVAALSPRQTSLEDFFLEVTEKTA